MWAEHFKLYIFRDKATCGINIGWVPRRFVNCVTATLIIHHGSFRRLPVNLCSLLWCHAALVFGFLVSTGDPSLMQCHLFTLSELSFINRLNS